MKQPPRDPDWNQLRAFLATARTGSFSAASRQLGLTQPTLSRQVAALERGLSLMLFERVGRGLALTEAGRDLLAHVGAMGEAATRAALSASGRQTDISGHIRITASDVMSATLLPAALIDLRRIAPQLHVDIVATNDIRDLMRREADIALRHDRPDQPNLVARLVREAHGHFYAATDYLDRRGRPTTRAELAALDWVGYGDIPLMIDHLRRMDLPLTPEAFRVSSENGIVAWEMVCAGLGVSPMDDLVARRDPRVEPVLPDDLSVQFPVWLVTHREIHTSPRIRLVFDLLDRHLAGATVAD